LAADPAAVLAAGLVVDLAAGRGADAADLAAGRAEDLAVVRGAGVTLDAVAGRAAVLAVDPAAVLAGDLAAFFAVGRGAVLAVEPAADLAADRAAVLAAGGAPGSADRLAGRAPDRPADWALPSVPSWGMEPPYPRPDLSVARIAINLSSRHRGGSGSPAPGDLCREGAAGRPTRRLAGGMPGGSPRTRARGHARRASWVPSWPARQGPSPGLSAGDAGHDPVWVKCRNSRATPIRQVCHDWIACHNRAAVVGYC